MLVKFVKDEAQKYDSKWYIFSYIQMLLRRVFNPLWLVGQ